MRGESRSALARSLLYVKAHTVINTVTRCGDGDTKNRGASGAEVRSICLACTALDTKEEI